MKASERRRIMVIDDDPDVLDIIMEPLRWEGYEVRGFTEVEEAILVANDWKPSVVLLDWRLIGHTAVDILKRIKHTLQQNVSVLIVSANSETDAIINGLDSGADDYIVKPFVPLEMLARVRSQLRLRDLHDQLLVANQQLKELAETDDLTGLFNMRSLYQRLDFEIERGRRFNRGVCVVMIDMDHFKVVNDGHDHLFGSFVIAEVGNMIKQSTRNIDIPARYGGDEFLIVLTEITADGAELFCERLRRNIEKHIFTNGKDSIKLTISVGFAVTHFKEHINSKELVRRADHALYESKRNGRNRVSTWEHTIGTVRELSSSDRKALKKTRKKAI